MTNEVNFLTSMESIYSEIVLHSMEKGNEHIYMKPLVVTINGDTGVYFQVDESNLFSQTWWDQRSLSTPIRKRWVNKSNSASDGCWPRPSSQQPTNCKQTTCQEFHLCCLYIRKLPSGSPQQLAGYSRTCLVSSSYFALERNCFRNFL